MEERSPCLPFHFLIRMKYRCRQVLRLLCLCYYCSQYLWGLLRTDKGTPVTTELWKAGCLSEGPASSYN